MKTFSVPIFMKSEKGESFVISGRQYFNINSIVAVSLRIDEGENALLIELNTLHVQSQKDQTISAPARIYIRETEFERYGNHFTIANHSVSFAVFVKELVGEPDFLALSVFKSILHQQASDYEQINKLVQKDIDSRAKSVETPPESKQPPHLNKVP